jgi:asparagine synthase (glutamine-hydrolysing)
MTNRLERLKAMVESMQHRGPDDNGVFASTTQRTYLANCRLAIRDLSSAGHMPMSNLEKTVWITYNGEIYNTEALRLELEGLGFKLFSGSDTELILHGYEAWGKDVVKRLRGMFAFAIYDERNTQIGPHVFIARDRLGIKPLYYSDFPGTFLFASEIKTLVASGLVNASLDPAGLVGYLMLGAVPSPLTIYRGVKVLEPGCTLTLPLDSNSLRFQLERYWSLPTDMSSVTDQAQVVEQVQALLAEAVRIRLVSDVPLGAFLSGGLDSSSIVALMRKASNGTIRTCSMIFEEASYSEAYYAREMAKAVGAEHYERTITAADVLTNLPHIVNSMDQPSLDGVNTYFVSQTAKEAGLTVALTGLGGDELFGGYPNTFQGIPQVLKMLKLIQVVPGGTMLTGKTLALVPGLERWRKLTDILPYPPSVPRAYLVRRGLFSARVVKSLLAPEVWYEGSKLFDPVQHVLEHAGSYTDTLSNANALFNWISRAELGTYTSQQLIRDTDVMSMAHSLEVREPLLDHCLLETVLRLPMTIKTNGTGPKPLLLKAMWEDLPPVIRERSDKKGFTFPFDLWLKGPLKSQMEQLLANSATTALFQPHVLAEKWAAFQNGHIHWSSIWALLSLQAWLEVNSLKSS